MNSSAAPPEARHQRGEGGLRNDLPDPGRERSGVGLGVSPSEGALLSDDRGSALDMKAPIASDIDSLYRRYGYVVLRRAERLLGSTEEARDVLHDVFEGLVARPEQFRATSSFATWLYATTTHACLSRLRKRRRRIRLLQRHVVPRAGTGATAHDQVLVRELLRRLPAKLVDVAIYYYVDEMTQDEIAALLGCSRRHVGNQLARVVARVGRIAGQS